MAPIRESGSTIVYTPADRKFAETGVGYDDEFAVADRSNIVKQVKFDVVPTSSGPGTVTIEVDVAGDQTINLTSIAGNDSFTTIQPDNGTSPVASSANDTLTLTSSNATVNITGNASTKTIDFKVNGVTTALTQNHIFVGNASNIATDVAMSGDATIVASGALTVGTVGASSAANIHTAELIANAATSANTASAVVRRDASGNFSAGTITASLTGHASLDALATRLINTTAPLTGGGDLSADRTIAIPKATTLVDGYLAAADFTTFNNKQTATLTNTHILVGNASNAATDVAVSGDVTIANTGAVTIANLAVTNAKIANATIDLTTKVTGILPVANGGTNSSAALNNNRVMQSSGGAVVEAAAITAARALKSDANGIPVASTATAASLDALSGTNTGDLTLAAFDASPNANGASLSGQVLTLQPASGTQPGGVSTTTQTFAGAKTFSTSISSPTITDSGMTAGSVLFAGTGGLLSQDNANFFWDDTNNYLGLGTTGPADVLHATSASTGYTGIRIQNTSTSGKAYLLASTGSAAGSGVAKFGLFDVTANLYRWIVDTNGTMGVGNQTSPNQAGGGGILDVTVKDGLGAAASTALNLTHLTTATASTNFGVRLEFCLQDSSGVLQEAATINGIWTTATNGSVASAITFFTRTGGGAFTEKMRIDATGNVGIGTASPGSALEVGSGGQVRVPNGSQSLPSYSFTAHTDAGVFSSGNEVAFSVSAARRGEFNSSGQFAMASLGTASLPVFTITGDPNTGLFSPAADTIALTTGGTERFRIGTTGLVGINTTATPTGQLQIVATSSTTVGLVVSAAASQTANTEEWRNSSAGIMSFVDASGNIGTNVAGVGFKVKEGTNARMGVAVLVGGTVTVSNTSITANTRIFTSRSTTGGVEGTLSTTQINATSFTINSNSVADTSTINWLLIEPS